MSTPRTTPSKILIVEDESVVSMDLEASLKRLGYQISGSATSGEEALQEVRWNRPDLILMDIQLHGDMDGLTTADIMNQQFDLPVVFITANVNEETIGKARQSGSYGFLNKPFRHSELNATIQIALHQHEAGQKLSADRERLEEQVYLTSEALGQTREELQALTRHLMQAQEKERGRIARELHDDLGQRAALLGMQADVLKRKLPPESRDALSELQTGLNALAQGLREVSHKLHPSIIADLGLTEALESLINDFRSQKLAIRASLERVHGLPLDVSTSLYRIAQESLTNVLKHAPASTVRVKLAATGTEVHLRVADNGHAFSVDNVKQRGGLGLISMQERARLVGGNLQLTAEPDKGTTVLVRVPLRP